MREVRFYKITDWGRQRIYLPKDAGKGWLLYRTMKEEEALIEAHRNDPKVKAIVKETKETIYSA